MTATPEKTRRRFKQLIDDDGGPSAAALRLSCSLNMVNRLVDGSRAPGMQLARAIQELYGVAMQEWVETPRTETVKKIA